MEIFYRQFAITPSTRVLDVGGSPLVWKMCSYTPRLTFINLIIRERMEGDWLMGDGCFLPFPDQAFDVVYSNSVIEHLGTAKSQAAFASECRRVGKRYYVQTPNKSFPVEPHLLTPFVHWLPASLEKRMLRNFTVWGWVTRPSQNACDAFMKEILLLKKKDFRALFPDAQIFEERFVGMVKSFTAVGGSSISR